MATNTYIILGDPTHLFIKSKNQHIFTQHQKLLIDYERQFEDQRIADAHFSGPISVHIDFYLPSPDLSNSKKTKLEGSYNPSGCSLDVLAQFIRLLKNAGLYRSEATVCSLSVSKFYSTEPKVSFKIEELK